MQICVLLQMDFHPFIGLEACNIIEKRRFKYNAAI